jgi:hypothetical protein
MPAPAAAYNGPALARAKSAEGRVTMMVRPGDRVLFVRSGKAREGWVFAVREGACSVECPGNRAYYLERWEVLLVLGFDEAYVRWLEQPLPDDVRV